jgi:lipid-binding SYLF domain-containing protein
VAAQLAGDDRAATDDALNAITRHNGAETLSVAAGPIGDAGTAISRACGGLMDVAETIVAFGIFRDVRLSHDC